MMGDMILFFSMWLWRTDVFDTVGKHLMSVTSIDL